MGGKPREKLYDDCLCCEDDILTRYTSLTPNLPTLTLRKIGLCQDCLEGNCTCENTDDLCDQLCALEGEYDDKIKALKLRIDELEAARKRGDAYEKARSS